VTQKTPPKAREADDGDGRVSLKEYGDPAHADEGHQSHILDSGAKVRGQQGYSACFNAGQDSFSTIGWYMSPHAMPKWRPKTGGVVPRHPIIHSSNKACIVVRQRNNTTFSSKISAREARFFVCTHD